MLRVLPLVLLVGCAAEDVVESELPADDDDALAWDAAPPADLPDGTIWRGVLACGLYVGPVDRTWALEGGVWTEPPPGAEGPTLPREEVLPCMQQGPKTLVWDDDGAIAFDAAGWTHDLRPSPSANLWLGEGTPTSEATPDCLDGLAAVGLELPVRFTLTLTELQTP